jgi:leucyl aminopeptidase (aminopeptidase T)
MATLEEAADTVLRQCLGTRAGERLLIVDDRPHSPIAAALEVAARALGTEAIWMVMLPRARNGEEPPDAVAAAMRAVDVVIAPTSRSLTHTRARRGACAAGARVASMPGVTEEMAARALVLDYAAMAARCRGVAAALSQAERVRIRTALGTDLSLWLEGREGIPDTGLLDQPGAYGNLPAGEAFIAPIETRSAGTLVVDASMAGLGVLQEPIRLTLAGGAIVGVDGGPEAEQFGALLDSVGAAGRVLCELGVGTNDRARVSGVVLEDEKVLGTVHLAFGNNVGFGGTNDVPFHVDGVVHRPTLEIDGELLIRNGEFLMDQT